MLGYSELVGGWLDARSVYHCIPFVGSFILADPVIPLPGNYFNIYIFLPNKVIRLPHYNVILSNVFPPNIVRVGNTKIHLSSQSMTLQYDELRCIGFWQE